MKHGFIPLVQAIPPLLKGKFQGKENINLWESSFMKEEQASGNKPGWERKVEHSKLVK